MKSRKGLLTAKLNGYGENSIFLNAIEKGLSATRRLKIGKAFNNNVKQIHLLNYPAFAEPVITLAKKFLNPKIAQRFYFHKSYETILDYVSRDILPKDFGGNGPSLREYNDTWKQIFSDYKERFDTLDKLQVNEALRPTPLINDDILGYYGNFKKVNVD